MMNMPGYNHSTSDMLGHHVMPGDSTHSMPGDSSHSMHMGHSMQMNGNHSVDGMQMYFHIDLGVYMLFRSLLINSISAMVGACIVTFILALLYEGLKVMREQLLRKAVSVANYAAVTNPDPGSHDVIFSDRCTQKYFPTEKRVNLLSRAHFLQTGLHMLQILLSYVLMLIFMTYSVWLCIAVILGAGAGYFLFAWKRTISVNLDINDHCH